MLYRLDTDRFEQVPSPTHLLVTEGPRALYAYNWHKTLAAACDQRVLNPKLSPLGGYDPALIPQDTGLCADCVTTVLASSPPA